MERTISKLPLPVFFSMLTEYTFQNAGVRELTVPAYVAGMLNDFARAERLYNPFQRFGEEFEYGHIFAMVNSAGKYDPFRRMVVLRHVGDVSLFMLGLFKEHVKRRGFQTAYRDAGRSAYVGVSRYHDGGEISGLFQSLSDNFDRAVVGLNEMREKHVRLQVDYDRFLIKDAPTGI